MILNLNFRFNILRKINRQMADEQQTTQPQTTQPQTTQPLKSMFQQASEFTKLMEVNAKKVFDGKINIDHITKMVSDETAEFFKPLKDFKNRYLVDGKYNENEWPNDKDFYVDIWMQLIDGLFDALYYVLQHLSTTKTDCDVLLNMHNESLIEGKYLDFHEINEKVLNKAITDSAFSKKLFKIWGLHPDTGACYFDANTFHQMSIKCFDVTASLSEMIRMPFVELEKKGMSEIGKSQEFAATHLCAIANIISRLSLWICTIPMFGDSPIFVKSRAIWDLIHNANMKKFGSDGRLEGTKWIKPSNFIPPDEDIKQLLKDSTDGEIIIRHVKSLLRAYLDLFISATKKQRDPGQSPVRVEFSNKQ